MSAFPRAIFFNDGKIEWSIEQPELSSNAIESSLRPDVATKSRANIPVEVSRKCIHIKAQWFACTIALINVTNSCIME